MAATADCDDDTVVIECRDPNLIETAESTSLTEIFILADDISSWDLSTILSHDIIKVKINRSRLIQESSYFQSLLSGNFSESSMHCFPIKWSSRMFLHILRFMHGYHLEVTFCSFLPLYHTALYFGLEKLMSECKSWFSDILERRVSSSQLQFDDLIHVWDFGYEQAIDWIVEPCTSYVAKNFMWAITSDAFVHLPYSYLVSCVKHSHLTVDSERHLCEALLAWTSTNSGLVDQMSCNADVWTDKSNLVNIIKDDCNVILEEVRASLLPLWFILGKCRCRYFCGFAKQGIAATFSLLQGSSKDSRYMGDGCNGHCMKIRLTKYSERLDLSGCPQLTAANLVLSLLPQPSSVDALLLEGIQRTSINLEHPKWLSYLRLLPFGMLLEVDISKCSRLHLGAAIHCFQKSFRLLRAIRMTHFLNFETKKLWQLIEKCSSLQEVDLTVDVNPFSFSSVSVLYSESVTGPLQKNYMAMSSYPGTRQIISNITKLTLEGRTDLSDPELHDIGELCLPLCYVNIRCCTQVTDCGISNLILKCKRLHSIIASETSFGLCSISALCSRMLRTGQFCMETDKDNLKSSAVSLQMLHIGGCKGVTAASLVVLLSTEYMLRSLCLRDTCLDDDALYSFLGDSLEMLDVSNTMISAAALSHVVVNNAGLKHLEAKGCRNLIPHQSTPKSRSSLIGELFSVLGKNCKLEGLAIGWGYSFSSLDVMAPAVSSLKSINVGLGGSLSPEGLTLLSALTTSLECVTLVFQIISDAAIMKLLETQRNLQALSLCYCMGDLSPLSLMHSMPTLRKLKLERVTPWMTNDHLTRMTHDFPTIIELSLVGCTHLNVDSQQIISSGWPGLISLRLEDCGSVTADGVGFVLECKALEDLLLCHNGPGLQRRMILDAASELPMLRSISLDWCDACQEDFDLPDFADRCSLSNVKISRCKLRKCTLDIGNLEGRKRPVHKETLVLVWNSNSLQRTVVKERMT